MLGKGFELCLEPLQVSLANLFVVFGLFRVIGDNETPATGTFADIDLLDMEIVANSLEPAATIQSLLIEMAPSEFFVKNVSATGSLQGLTVFITVHAAIHCPDNVT